MDLSLPLIGILGMIGYNMSKNNTKREIFGKRTNVPGSESPIGKNIYESKHISRNTKEEKKRFDGIRKNNKTVKINSASDASPLPKNVRFQEKNLDNYSGMESISPDNKIYRGPMFNMEKFYTKEEDTKEFIQGEGFENISPLSGQETDFNHKNMVPFFGARMKAKNNSDTLGRYTGRDINTHKSEIEASMNGPSDNIHGNVLYTDKVDKDRFVLPENRTGLLPFNQERVIPIAGEFNRGTQKTIEELRAANNQKGVLENVLISGKELVSKRGSIGELPEPRVNRLQELGKSKQFTTSGEKKGDYFKGTEHYRYSKKKIISETTPDFLKGVDYNKGSRFGVSKTDDSNSTLVQQDKRGNFKGDWVRSRKSVNTLDNTPNTDGYVLREQERETGNRSNLGIASDTTKGILHRIDEQLKTTNKELSLYTYKGGASGNSIKKPENRNAWYENETKTKDSFSYTPGGGSKLGVSGLGADDVHFDSKDRAIPENYNGALSTVVKEPISYKNIGDVTIDKHDTQRDYRSRLDDILQKKSLDRPYGELSNLNR